MPRTKPKTEETTTPATAVNGPLPEVLTLDEAAAYLRLAESDVLRLIHDQGLPGRQVGREWRFFKTAIQHWLSTGPAPRPSKEAQLAAAGSWKDDPLVEDELRDIYRRRSRPMTEEGP